MASCDLPNNLFLSTVQIVIFIQWKLEAFFQRPTMLSFLRYDSDYITAFHCLAQLLIREVSLISVLQCSPNLSPRHFISASHLRDRIIFSFAVNCKHPVSSRVLLTHLVHMPCKLPAKLLVKILKVGYPLKLNYPLNIIFLDV